MYPCNEQGAICNLRSSTFFIAIRRVKISHSSRLSDLVKEFVEDVFVCHFLIIKYCFAKYAITYYTERLSYSTPGNVTEKI